MADHHIFIHMPYGADELHDMAWDAEKYPLFINLISHVRIRDRSETEMLADVLVRYKFLRESFATKVKRKLQTGEINVILHKGPLRRLENSWKFHPLADGTTLVEFYVGYEFSIPILERLFETKKEKAEQIIINAFSNRAKQVCKQITPDPAVAAIVKTEIAELEGGL